MDEERNMKKLLFPLILASGMLLTHAVAFADQTEEYIMCGGDQLQLTVYNHPDLSSPVNATNNPYIVRPDGKLSVPLIGEIDCNGKTVTQFTKELTERLSEYVVNPLVTVNITKLGTTRVYVLGEIKKQGLYELEKSHRLLDALSKAEGFLDTSGKKKIFVIRRGEQEPFLKVNINDFLTKGDKSKNIVLNEGDCVYLTSNGKITFQKDILPFLSGIYMASEVKDNENN